MILAEAYEDGCFEDICVDEDLEKAVYWLTQAAEQGDASAQFHLANAYDDGRGVEQDKQRAVYWFQVAADNGDLDALNNLGAHCAEGDGRLQWGAIATRALRPSTLRSRNGHTRQLYPVPHALYHQHVHAPRLGR